MSEKIEKNLDYIRKRKKLSGFFFESALPNEYLVEVGKRNVKPILGGRRFRIFRRFIRVPAYVQTLHFITDNANVDFQGIGIEGYASWRINPDSPEMAIRTLDFFDEDDPMARTNEELKTICVEAVRHVIANMTIDDALKKKDEIGDNLKNQLKSIETKWGILFDQVGIEKVRVMSASLFENLQAQYRNSLRLEVEKKRIDTDRQIAGEENNLREKTETETQETEKRLSLQRISNDSSVKSTDLEEKARIANREREIQEDNYRKEAEFRMSQQQIEFDLNEKKNRLDLELSTLEQSLVESNRAVETVRADIERKKLEVEKIRHEIQQSFTKEFLAHNLIDRLPEIYENLKIDNYTVLDGGGENGISPVGRLFAEVASLLKQTGFDIKGKENDAPREGKKGSSL